MTYFPKNKIKTNLYSNGNLVYKLTNQPYTGFYHKLYNGSIFTGKNQFDKPNDELVEYKQPTEPPEGINPLEINYKTSTLTNYNYTILKKISIDDNKIPVNSIVNPPQSKDYEVGIYTRYFLVKINEEVYLEINKDLYDQINNRNPKYNWEIYNTFKLLWDIKGDVKETYNTNKNLVELTESRLGRNGLGLFLNFDYLKYFEYIEEDNKFTDGSLLIDIRNKPYVGNYHIDKIKGYRTGNNKNETPNQRLFLKEIYK